MRTSRLYMLLASLITIVLLALVSCSPSQPISPETPEESVQEEEPTQTTALATPEESVQEEKATELPTEPTAEETVPRPGGELVVGHTLDPSSLDPSVSDAPAIQSIYGHISEPFAMMDTERREIIPWLAESWEWVEDKTLRLHLREGVKFTNGEDWNAEAAKYSLDVLAESPVYTFWVADSYDRTEIIDDHTVDIHLNSRAGMWLSILAKAGFTYPPEYTQEVGLEAYGNDPIGTGPYVLGEWVKGDHITLEANMEYWGGPPPLDTITFRVIPEEAARVAALETGEIDIAITLSGSSAGRIESSSDLVLMTRRGLRMFGTMFDMTIDHPVSDKLVRQALNYAVDKEGLVQLFEGFASPMTPQWLTPDTIGYNPNLEMYPYDPAMAQQLLEEAGYPNGFQVDLKYTIDRYPLDKEMGEAVAGYLEAVGLEVTQIPLEFAELVRQHNELPSMGPLHQWGLATPADACMTLAILTPGSLFRHFGPRPEFDDLLEQGCEIADPEERREIYTRLTEIMADDPHTIFLVIPDDLYGVSNKVVDFVPRADQVLWLNEVYKEN